jgi:hypothetical protein
MEFLNWLADTGLSNYIKESAWTYYGLLGIHAIGMGTVVGSVFMLCLRINGFSKALPISLFDRLFKFAWWGFYANLGTGLLLFASNGPNLIVNVPFLLKITFIALGGVTTLIMWRRIETERSALMSGRAASGVLRLIATIDFGLWLAAIMAGRIIAYTIDY